MSGLNHFAASPGGGIVAGLGGLPSLEKKKPLNQGPESEGGENRVRPGWGQNRDARSPDLTICSRFERRESALEPAALLRSLPICLVVAGAAVQKQPVGLRGCVLEAGPIRPLAVPPTP